ncbi:MAG: 5-formyltetrahydrofolate cyclo-ligase [Candidatus Diapherotrites archaeon]|uniref:5-formyltetrahydrofolate cyclo-ligase n=1 Tax=Candidatus Iainarchaeum sp. TaxID=3101447 RepID=A0A2D6LNW8_9ARCH|nr:5-formyltetrahydrofolate cyclo-ligase [Candidatus Diapherotrites archaeon]|tara:strand:+ start:2836 stop:3396 length:561 start_codon:yes stop_codon:yes gene_type:complete
MDKAVLRKQIFEKRKSVSKDEVLEKSKKIFENLFSLEEINQAQNIAVYISFNNEVETKLIIEKLWKLGKNVFIPVMKEEHLHFAKINSFEGLAENKRGILEPKEELFISPNEIELFIVPGLAFDKEGNRLGWGKGFYDHFFNFNKIDAKKIGLAFDFQIVIQIPHKSHDVKMDFVVTEKNVYYGNK